jgi:hypothetical protein
MTIDHAIHLRFVGSLFALLSPRVIYVVAWRSKELVGVVVAITVSVAVM